MPKRILPATPTGFFGLSVLIAWVLGCAIYSVIGARGSVLISEGQEIQMGRDADQDIVQPLGIVEDTDRQEYVQELGERMAGQSEPPDLPWTFQLADVPFVVVRTPDRHWLLEGNWSGKEDCCE